MFSLDKITKLMYVIFYGILLHFGNATIEYHIVKLSKHNNMKHKTTTVELRSNKVPTNQENVFVITGVCYLGVWVCSIHFTVTAE